MLLLQGSQQNPLAQCWRGQKKKGLGLSPNPVHSFWWSWRESNPRPLECHGSNYPILLNFYCPSVDSQSIILAHANDFLALQPTAANGQDLLDGFHHGLPTARWQSCWLSVGRTICLHFSYISTIKSKKTACLFLKISYSFFGLDVILFQAYLQQRAVRRYYG